MVVSHADASLIETCSSWLGMSHRPSHHPKGLSKHDGVREGAGVEKGDGADDGVLLALVAGGSDGGVELPEVVDLVREEGGKGLGFKRREQGGVGEGR